MPAAAMMLANPHNTKADTLRFCNQAKTRPAPAQVKAKLCMTISVGRSSCMIRYLCHHCVQSCHAAAWQRALGTERARSILLSRLFVNARCQDSDNCNQHSPDETKVRASQWAFGSFAKQ